MKNSEKLQPFVILGAVLIGLALGQLPAVAERAGRFILPLLMLMLTGAFLAMPRQGFSNLFRARGAALATVAVNFAWTPLFAWLLGWLFLREHPALWVGFLMLLVTPCTDWYLVFTAVAKGNLPLSVALLPVNLTLQLLLLPIYLFILAGTLLSLEWRTSLQSVILVLALPLLAAAGLRYLVVHYKTEIWLEQRLLPMSQLAQTGLLALAIAAMFASEGQAVGQNPQALLRLLPPLALFFGGNLLLAFVVGKWLKSDYETFVSLSYTTLARNSPIALAVALAAFPHEPFVALALVIGPLIELPVLALIAQLLLWLRGRDIFPVSGI
jgi:arsenite transporter